MVSVSVIIPTYNQSNRLQRAIVSVEEQTYSDIELIIVDDFSKHNVSELVGEINCDYEIIKHDENKGGAAARNTGIKAATGEYLAFLDDDDVWKRNKIKRQINAFKKANRQVGAVYTGVRRIDSDGNDVLIRTPEVNGNVTKELYLNNFIGTFSSIMVSSNVVHKSGMLDERFPRMQDWEWYIRLSENCAFDVIPDIQVIQEKQDKNTFEMNIKAAKLFIDKYRNNWRNYGFVFDRMVMSNLFAKVGRSGVYAGKQRRARKYLLKSIFYNPLNRRAVLFLGLSFGGSELANAARNYKREFI